MTRFLGSYFGATCALALFFAPLFGINLRAQDPHPREFSVLVRASVQESPPRITLSWPASGTANSYTISRRTVDSGWSELATIGGGETSYTDGGVAVGTKYEYQIRKNTSRNYTGYGYVASGIRVPQPDYRGKVILVVENSIGGAIGAELAQLEKNLIGDGWTVVRRGVNAGDSPTAVRQMIQGIYNADRANTKAVFLIGHVPVPYSGNIYPDGHPNHRGAWPADLYYGEMDGNWTDSSVNTTQSERTINHNVPGDGKFDQSVIPSDVELMVGRVDFWNMTCYENKANSRSEVDLTRQYFQKNHRWRHGQIDVAQRGLICDNFADKGDDPIAGSAWRSFPGFFGAENIQEVEWDGFFPAATSGSYLWSYGSGGGTYYYSSGVGTSDDFALKDINVVFTMWMGSYFGDWNNESNFLRAALGSGNVLSSSYSGFPHSLYFPMGMGETLGYCIRLSQNNREGGLYPPFNQGAGEVHVALHGDPTLRMHPVKPPGALSIAAEQGTARLSWGASSESGLEGYHVYRATSAAGPFTRITESPVGGTSFTDNPAAGNYTYMVRAIKLEQRASGSYLNPSQGVMASASVTGSAPQPPPAPVLQAEVLSHSSVRLRWADLANETGYRVEIKAGASGGWSEIANLGANAISFDATGLQPSTEYFFRARAYNDAGASAYSAEARAVTTPAPEPAASVSFVEEDSSTSGDWPDKFGAEGFVVVRGSAEPPGYLQYSFSGQSEHLWEPATADPRAPWSGPDRENRVAAALYGTDMMLDLNVSSEDSRRLAFYFLDWDRQGRAQRVTITDAATGIELDSREVANFQDGKFLVYDIRGSVRIELERLAGPNAALSGIFAGGAVPGPINDALRLGLERASAAELILRVEGASGQRYSVEASTDFSAWEPVAEGQLSGNGAELTVPLDGEANIQVFRAVTLP